jgi:hypothetical protein
VKKFPRISHSPMPLQLVQFLLENGANPNSRGAFQRTPLWRAAFGCAAHAHRSKAPLPVTAFWEVLRWDSVCPWLNTVPKHLGPLRASVAPPAAAHPQCSAARGMYVRCRFECGLVRSQKIDCIKSLLEVRTSVASPVGAALCMRSCTAAAEPVRSISPGLGLSRMGAPEGRRRPTAHGQGREHPRGDLLGQGGKGAAREVQPKPLAAHRERLLGVASRLGRLRRFSVSGWMG